MRKVFIFAMFAAVCAMAGAQGGVIHGNGTPSVTNPNCAFSRFYVDDSTGKMYQATSGSPCVWTDSNSAIQGLSSDGSKVAVALPFAFQDASQAVSAAYNTVGIRISPNCPPNSTTCIKIYGDAQHETDCTSNSTTTITCPSGNFTQADVGKVAWATTQGTGGGVGYLLYTTLVCGQTTIASVTNSTTAVLANACTASGSGNVVLIWGHDDGATLAAIDPGCNVIHVSTAGTFIMTGQPFLKASTCTQQLRTSVGAPGAALIGDGFNASQTVFVLTPNFAYAGCNGTTGTCIGSGMRALANLQFWGTGLTSAANSNCATGVNKAIVSGYQPSTVMFGVDVAGICPGTSGMIGILIDSNDEVYSEAGAQSVGTVACEAYNASGIHFQANDCRNDNVSGGYGLKLVSAQVLSYGNYPIVGAYVDGSSQLSSWKSYYLNGSGVPSITTVAGSRVVSIDDQIANVTHAGTLITQGSTYSTITNTGLITSMGGNKLGALPNSSGSAQWTGTGVLFGSLSGTLASSSTLGFFGFGQYVAPAGNSTVNAGINVQQVPLSGSVFGLACSAGTSGSGTVTLMKTHNGTTAATTLTCAFSAGTSCFDNSHFDVPVLGDSYSAQIVTPAGNTLANVTCSALSF